MKRQYKLMVSILLAVSFVFGGCGSISGQNDTKKTEEPEMEITVHKMNKDTNFDNGYLTINFEGLKEYEELKSDRYEEKPAKGKIYLVLFLGFRNIGDKYYFNESYFSSKVDGKKCDHTVLFNEPEGFKTAFANYDTNTETTGFVVWEVDKDWQKLEVTYEGLKDVEGNIIEMEFTKDDLQDPIQRAQ